MGLTVLYKDITTVEADAVVNSTNPLLYGFSGGDAQLHALGGPAFEKECAEKEGTLLPGEAIFTNAYNIPAKYVIHTHIPAFAGGVDGEAAILRSCYRSSLELAEQLGCKSVAFPLIAAGSMGFPIPKALEIAVVSISEYLQLYGDLNVFLVIRGGAATEIAQSMMGDLDEYVQKHFGKGLGEKEKKTLAELIAAGGESFVEILYRYMDEKGIDKPSQLYKAAHVSKQAFSKLISGSVAKPSMETVVGLAFGLKLTYEEAVPFFNAAGIALSDGSTYDIIVKYFLQQQNYDIWEFNEQLLKYNFNKLIGADE